MRPIVTNCSGGLYRDDGLIVVSNATGPKADRIRKDITELFKSEGLKITVETNTSTTNFLDITLDMDNNRFCPYTKPNNTPRYIHVSSNHQQTIIRQLPKMINKRISDLSSAENGFTNAKKFYEDDHKKNGHNAELTYEKPKDDKKADTKTPRKRKRKILWFNPPFNRSVQTNIGKRFFALLSKHFAKEIKANAPWTVIVCKHPLCMKLK